MSRDECGVVPFQTQPHTSRELFHHGWSHQNGSLLDDLVITSIRITPVRGVYYNIGMSLAVIAESDV